MASYPFRLINVFASSPLAGNPLCVFEDARALDDATMQALALQFNLSETTFLHPSQVATARVRIFTPTFEMPFAGHPTLGSAHVVRDLTSAGDAITLELRAGVIPVAAKGDVWTLKANAPRHRAPPVSREDLAAMLGLVERDLAGADSPPLWIDTGVEQLLIPLATFDAVRRAAPRPDALLRYGRNENQSMAYAFAREGQRVLARFFFLQHGSLVEDPGTGSACANLGGWLLATGAALPQTLSIEQGEAVGRLCRLGLEVTPERSIFVSGRVVELGRGTVTL